MRTVLGRVSAFLLLVAVTLIAGGCVGAAQVAEDFAGAFRIAVGNPEISVLEEEEDPADVRVQTGTGALTEETPGESPPDDGWRTAVLDTARDASYLSDAEKDVILELNKVRSNPAAYAEQYLVPRRQFYHGNTYSVPGRIDLMTNEGVGALDECIRVLTSSRPLPPLQPAYGLSQAAEDHVEDTGASGTVGHTGVDGSTMSGRVERYGDWNSLIGENISYGHADPREIVIQLIVDDGVASRGHRQNIMQPDFSVVGVAIGNHAGYGSMCVQDFAGGFEESGR